MRESLTLAACDARRGITTEGPYRVLVITAYMSVITHIHRIMDDGFLDVQLEVRGTVATKRFAVDIKNTTAIWC